MSSLAFKRLVAIAGMLKDVELARLARLQAQDAAIVARQSQIEQSARRALHLRGADPADRHMVQQYRAWTGQTLAGLTAERKRIAPEAEVARKAAARSFGQHQVLSRLQVLDLQARRKKP